MLYRVVADDIDILDFTYPDLVLLSPRVEMELDAAGSFEFTLPPTHRYYDMFNMSDVMSMSIEVYEDQILHFFGRPVELHLDFYKNKKVYCEGALSYFNDSVQRKKEYDDGTYLSEFFQDVIARHNSMVPESRQFTIDVMTVPDHTIYRKVDYEQTSDVLKNKILDAEEGHFFLTRLNNINYISFLKDETMPYSCNQAVTFGENLLDFTYSFDGKDFATCVMPIGSIISENEGGTGDPLTIESVNSGSDILIGNSAENFGQIVKVQHYSDIKDAYELLSEAQKYLTKVQYNAILIECSTLDLHSLDNTKVLFRIGQIVHCVSYPHAIEIDLPVSKLSLKLDSAEKQITLGRIPKKTLSRFYKEVYDHPEDNYGDYGDYGDGWGIVPPDTDGGTPTMKKMPIGFVVTQPPNKTSYGNNESIDYTGLVCYAVSSFDPVTFFTDNTYTTGLIPYSEIQKPLTVMKTADALKTSSVKALLRWPNPYKTSQIFEQYITLTNSVKKAQEDAAAELHGSEYPDHIAVISTGLDYVVHKDGQFINTMGLRVKAYYPDGAEYDADGYNGGLIPNTELRIAPKKADAGQIISYERDVSDTDLIAPVYLVPLSVGMIYNNLEVKSVTGTIYGVNIPMGAGRTDTFRAVASLTQGASVTIARSNGSYPQIITADTPYTYGGKTCYIKSASVSGYNAGDSVPTSAYQKGMDASVVAGIALLGGKPMSEGEQVINVFWTAPDGNELTTTFNIRVKGGTQGGGR